MICPDSWTIATLAICLKMILSHAQTNVCCKFDTYTYLSRSTINSNLYEISEPLLIYTYSATKKPSGGVAAVFFWDGVFIVFFSDGFLMIHQFCDGVVCSVASKGNLHSPNRVSNVFVQFFYNDFLCPGAG